jgi:colanic acid/amylovoran biosynthesis glycosyltransferase
MHPEVLKYRLLERTYYEVSVPHNHFKRFLKAIWLIIVNFHKSPFVIFRSLNIFKYSRQALSLRLLYKVVPYIGRKPYDIIHCHFGPNGLLGVSLRELGAIKGKIVTAFHGYDMSIYVKQQGNDVYNNLFDKGDLFLPISERWENRLVELGCGENKILVHHMGIDCGKLSFNMSKSGNGKHVRILTIARLVEKKGVEYGIRAVTELSRKYNNIEYNIVGDGPLRDNYTCLIQESNMSDKINLLGSKVQQQVYNLIATSHIFLCPSVTSTDGDQEGIPVALMETMMAGLPIVSTRHSGIPELVQDGVSGFLVPERDVDALAEKLIYLIEHPEIWSEMGRAGRAFVEANYDINKLNDRLVEIYQELLRNETGA